MSISKREFLKLSGLSAAAVMATACSEEGAVAREGTGLSSIIGDAVPIGVEERQRRIAKAQALMAEHDIDAILIEPGSAMLYFSGISWWRSERLTALVIPREGDIGIEFRSDRCVARDPGLSHVQVGE